MEKRKKVISPDDPLLNIRVDELSREYEAENADPVNNERLDEVHFQLSGLVGKNHLNLLREYTDRLIAQTSIDPCWFYCKGLEDAGKG